MKATKDAITKEEYRIKAVQDANKRMEDQIANLKRRQKMWQDKKQEDLEKFAVAYAELDKIDIEAELVAHQLRTEWSNKVFKKAELDKAKARAEADIAREEKQHTRLAREIAALLEHKCHACGQDLHDDAHETQLAAKQAEQEQVAAQIDAEKQAALAAQQHQQQMIQNQQQHEQALAQQAMQPQQPTEGQQ